MTVYGFYSVSVRQRTAIVRSRVKEHLENLKKRFQLTNKIIETPDRDYLFRIELPKAKWVKIVADMAEEQTWNNFKDAAALRNRTVDGLDYVHTLHEIWSIMFQLQLLCHPYAVERYADLSEDKDQREFVWGKGNRKKKAYAAVICPDCDGQSLHCKTCDGMGVIKYAKE